MDPSEEATITSSLNDVLPWLFAGSLSEARDLEPAVEEAARLLFLDTLGCAIGGGAKPELQALEAALAAVEPGTVRLPGMRHGLTAPAAASWSAMAATWDEACEGLARAHGRPGLHAFPVAVALTMARGGSLGDALLALVRGYEIGGRLGERLRIRPGLHVDGTWGTFGAVAAAGSVLGQRAATVMATIEAAACQTPMSLYLPVAEGATIRNSYVGEACRRAITLALTVGAGVTAPAGALDTLASLALDAAPDDTAIAPPGEWLVLQGYLKPFAAVRHVHYGAEAARRWRSGTTSASAIEAIELDVYPEALTYCGNRAPRTAIEAQFSLTYGVARMLVTGDLGPDAYVATALADPEVVRLEALIEVRTVEPRSPGARRATLRVTTGSGERQAIDVDRVPGDADQPMTVGEVAAKFLAYSRWLAGWPAERVVADVLEGPLDRPLADVVPAAA